MVIDGGGNDDYYDDGYNGGGGGMFKPQFSTLKLLYIVALLNLDPMKILV